jgi:hypothetical protein
MLSERCLCFSAVQVINIALNGRMNNELSRISKYVVENYFNLLSQFAWKIEENHGDLSQNIQLLNHMSNSGLLEYEPGVISIYTYRSLQ